MVRNRRGWNRSENSTLKKINAHERLQSLFVILLCSIFLFILCSELYMVNYQKKFTIFENKNSTSSNYVQKIKTWISVFKANFITAPVNAYDKKNRAIDEEVNEHAAYHAFLLNSRKNANKTFFFFNSSETFHKLFRKWLNSRTNELPLKISFNLNHKNICIDNGRSLQLLIIVTSSASHLESRAAIRETWGGYAKERGAIVVFFLGFPKNEKYYSRIIDENIKFNDIIQATFLDTYRNLTLKTISVLNWVKESCSLVKYVLKVDDDMFINVENFLNITEERNETMTILGELAHEWSPVRSPKNKWFTSYDDYPFNIYPDFVFGPSYMLSGDAIKILYENSIKLHLFHLEDVYITGFVAEKARIKRINLPAMFNTQRDLQPCNFQKLLSSHGHTPPDMRRHWMWLSRRNFKCIL
ncbi:beta-1,3-galactosyltransferase 5-like [Uloborus diversus]|uniref:beta-1,3-galactosyltransferase 5-like n=1 Tax=Uloborus diversus TaxID=327109 RepID=UPI002408F3F0|nr:beta-1,3-galactosyltransferase 5-like [Uloborus diversus]